MNRSSNSLRSRCPLCLAALLAMLALIARHPSVFSEDQTDVSASAIDAGNDGVKASSGKTADAAGNAEIDEPEYTPKTQAQLQKQLTAMQFKVTQNEGTEPAFRNQYWNNKKEGIYRCIVCGQSLFSSDAKYKSGTGWPSFFQPIKKNNVAYSTDFHLFYPRKEVHCSRCQAHLGHVFDDGPRDKTGKRYCMNSAAMRFVSAGDEKTNGRKSKGDSPRPPSVAKD